jgi:two-component system phosphate regulon sensor histidine kinase PhoR
MEKTMKTKVYNFSILIALVTSGFSMGFVVSSYLMKIYKHEATVMDLNIEKSLNYFDSKLPSKTDSISDIFTFENYDTLLKDAFAEHRITANFDFAISTDTANFIFFSSQNDVNTLKETEYIKALSSNQILHLHFIQQRNYLLYNIKMPLIISFLLLASIAFALIFLSETVKQQNELAKQKTNFINNITHELKTPIATIDFALANIENEKNINNPDKIRAITSIIRQENKRMNTQVERVLTAAKADKKALQINKEPVNIHDIIQTLSENFAIKIKEKGGTFQPNLNAEQAIIQGDAFHLTNVFSNLMDNAFKYSTNKIAIKVETLNTKNGLQINILDEGLGIPKKAQSKVFEQFYRVSTGDLHDVKGFGLGLSYVKAIIEQHNGKITLKSKLGKGSTFSVQFPIH